MSKTSEWSTPQDFFDDLNREFNLNLDVCASSENYKLPIWWDKEKDGLSQSWEGWRCWMNPPYGREIGKWVEKAAEGGGKDRSVLTSRKDRYQVVSRSHLQQGRNPLYKRPSKIRRIKELRTIPKHGRHIQK